MAYKRINIDKLRGAKEVKISELAVGAEITVEQALDLLRKSNGFVNLGGEDISVKSAVTHKVLDDHVGNVLLSCGSGEYAFNFAGQGATVTYKGKKPCWKLYNK